ncbi:MAG: S26 family signal peptidase [Ruminococcus sp.]|nr:S26 family signal peptidase [Ruminococcus sp.]
MMQSKCRDISIDEWHELARAAGEEGRHMALRFHVTGVSMVPTIRNGLDGVVVLPLDEERVKDVEKGDVILFRKKNLVGDYVLHRVWKVEGDKVQTIGDGNLCADEWITRDKIYGVAVELHKGNQKIRLDSAWMWLWGRLWLFLLPVRGPLLAGMAHLYGRKGKTEG